MIEFATEKTQFLVRQMWQKCFGDSDEFLDMYFSHKYKHENTLIYFHEGEAVASLQMLPYTITFYGKIVPFYYLMGLCTLPEYRRKGYMAQLIDKAHTTMKERTIPLAILIPAEEWLYGFYERYGYTQVFEKGNEPIPLKQLLQNNTNLKDAYRAFNTLYKEQNLCVQKSFDDFRAIVDDFIADGYPDKTNLSGMAHMIDRDYLLDLYKKKNSVVEVPIVDDKLLCRLLFGFRTNELDENYYKSFPVRDPIMNLMLE